MSLSVACVCNFVCLFVCYQHYSKTIKAVVMKLTELTSNSSRMMTLNSPGGSTLQWAAGRGSLCLTSNGCHCVDVLSRVARWSKSWPASEPFSGSGLGTGASLHLGSRRDNHHISLATDWRLRTTIRQGQSPPLACSSLPNETRNRWRFLEYACAVLSSGC